MDTNSSQKVIARSPGRINLIGEHIDYHGGFVLPAATHFETTFTLQKKVSSLPKATIKAEASGEEFTFSLDGEDAIYEGWKTYVFGVVRELQKLGGHIEGFTATFSGNVPIGAGMSSSASLTCSLAIGLNELFELGFDRIQLIQAAQMAEHHYVGIKCGIMDQFASVMGRKFQSVLIDCDTLEYSYHPIQLNEYSILLLNSNVTHELATSAYNDRRMQSEEGLTHIQKRYPEIQYLAHATMEMLESVKEDITPMIYRRCRHVITEQERVKEAVIQLARQDIPALGKLLYEAHDSLSKDYEVCCVETDFLVEQAKRNPEVLGARQMGGGFGGCVLHLIKAAAIQEYVMELNQVYEATFGKATTPYEIEIGDGASVERVMDRRV